MAVRVAQGLVIASLALLIIYGADAAVEQGTEERGFLNLDDMTRGIGFGGTAVALSTAGFFVSLKERSALVSILLMVNGVLIIIGGIVAVMASLTAGSSPAGGYSVLGMGIWILALGILKSLRSKTVKTA